MNRQQRAADKVDINMTPMIDIVFQLLTFFLFSIKAVDSEGNFAVKMPTPTNHSPLELQEVNPTQTLRLLANADGLLTLIQFAGRDYPVPAPELKLQLTRREVDDRLTAAAEPAFGHVQQQVQALCALSKTSAQDYEIELDCSPQLRYHYVMQAIDTVVGRYDSHYDQIQPLIEKIKFKPK